MYIVVCFSIQLSLCGIWLADCWDDCKDKTSRRPAQCPAWWRHFVSPCQSSSASLHRQRTRPISLCGNVNYTVYWSFKPSDVRDIWAIKHTLSPVSCPVSICRNVRTFDGLKEHEIMLIRENIYGSLALCLVTQKICCMCSIKKTDFL